MSVFGIYLSTKVIGIILLLICIGLFVGLLKDSLMAEVTRFTPGELNKVLKVTNKLNAQREENIILSKKNMQNKKLCKIYRRMRIFPYSESTKVEYVELIERLNVKDSYGYKVVPDELYVESCNNVIALVCACVILVVVGQLLGEKWIDAFGVFLAVLIPVVYRAPLTKLRKLKKKNLVKIDNDMIEFINMFYYRFSNKSIDFNLDDLIDSFLPLANPEMSRMLVRFQLDINGLGDETALNLLQKQYGDSTYVTTFCNVALGLLEKHPNAYVQLDSLFERLNTISRLKYKKVCELKHKKKKNAYKIILGIFCLEMLVFIVFQIMVIN